MRALDVATFGYAENLRAKQWPAFWVGLLSPPQQQNIAAENSSNNENTVKSTAFVRLEKVVFKEGNFQGNQNYELIQPNTLFEQFYAEIKKKHD